MNTLRHKAPQLRGEGNQEWHVRQCSITSAHRDKFEGLRAKSAIGEMIPGNELAEVLEIV